MIVSTLLWPYEITIGFQPYSTTPACRRRGWSFSRMSAISPMFAPLNSRKIERYSSRLSVGVWPPSQASPMFSSVQTGNLLSPANWVYRGLANW